MDAISDFKAEMVSITVHFITKASSPQKEPMDFAVDFGFLYDWCNNNFRIQNAFVRIVFRKPYSIEIYQMAPVPAATRAQGSHNIATGSD